ncbi:MAG: hypothetical protein ACK5MT_14185 [Actinomycetales bacterium]
MSFVVALATALAPTLASASLPAPQPTRPDWAGGFQTLINWGAWFALGVCVIGVIVTGGVMAIASRRGEGGEHATRLAWVLMGCIVIGSASGIVSGIL